MSGAAEFHTPVLGPETAFQVVNDPNGVYVDGTVGGGGHAEHMLERMGRRGRLIGIDRDPEAVQAAALRLRRFSDRLDIIEASFSGTAGGLGKTGGRLDLGGALRPRCFFPSDR